MAFKRGQHRRQRGLSLVELAIVMAVMGIVIGGVWVAAQRVSEEVRINTAVDQMFQIATNVRGLYAARQQIRVGDFSTERTSTNELNGTLKNAEAVSAMRKGVIPLDMCVRNCDRSNPWIRNAWDGPVGLRGVPLQASGLTPRVGTDPNEMTDNFGIVFRDVPPAACVVLATRTSRADAKLRLIMLSVFNPTGQHYALINNRLPISVENAAVSCTPTRGDTVDIQWVFSLH